MIDYLSVAGIVFRFEAGILLVILLFYQLAVFRILAFRVALTRLVASSALSLLVTVPIDSWFWRRWVWPEGEGFFFNVVLNKSNEWGTMPFYAYAVLFLPRVLMVAYPLSLLAAWRIPQSRQLLLPAWTYIFVFSLLPHKEWRFLIYVVPVLTGVAAAMMDQLWRDTHHSGSIRVLVTRIGLFGCLAASFMVALGMVYISSWNYPGGEALHVLHQKHDASASIRVHMDVGTAMTGASRFGQCKDETHASLDDYLDARYTHLITTVPPNSMPPDFDLVHVTHAFHRVRRRTSLAQWLKDLKQWRWRRFLAPLSVDIGPAIYTMQLRHPHATWLNHTLHKYPLVLYSKSYCPYCHAAKQLLASHCPNLQGIHVIEVDQQPDGAQIKQALIDRTGQRTFPHLFIGGTSYGGYDAMLAMEKDQLLGERLACPR
ncbi:Alg9-like mannosyltransferase family-domain-containing protein [Gongronella butleri]|nr:Alg9-like mannosyltransferase family-domain-containing protein [Gongronella butleri]